jgi:hypothetical protein
MSLQSCPKCGYAVSVQTLKCRHCLSTFGASSEGEDSLWSRFLTKKTAGVVLLALSTASLVYIVMHFQKGLF